MPFVFIIIIFYFLLIRPQQRRARQHSEFLQKLKRGDSVLTSSGILGTIEGITDKFVTLEIADGVRIRILKSQIASLANQNEDQKK
ncbi:MAG: preprotein translocase subunit YajC [Bdellovibrio sp.]|nr:MAG: preprotein translocase subunit YajC [Bdellovibrio sp.]